jgi:hypothetical protein
MKKQFKNFKRGQMVKVKVLGKTFVGAYVRLDKPNGYLYGFPHEIAFPAYSSFTSRPHFETQMFSDRQVSH